MLWLSVCRVGPPTILVFVTNKTYASPFFFCQYPKGNVSISRPPTRHSRYVLRVAEWDDHIRPACIGYLARKPNYRRKHVKSCGKSSCLSSVVARWLIVSCLLTNFFQGFTSGSSVACGNCGQEPPATFLKTSVINKIRDAIWDRHDHIRPSRSRLPHKSMKGSSADSILTSSTFQPHIYKLHRLRNLGLEYFLYLRTHQPQDKSNNNGRRCCSWRWLWCSPRAKPKWRLAGSLQQRSSPWFGLFRFYRWDPIRLQPGMLVIWRSPAICS